jgi:hypothetical protein
MAHGLRFFYDWRMALRILTPKVLTICKGWPHLPLSLGIDSFTGPSIVCSISISRAGISFMLSFNYLLYHRRPRLQRQAMGGCAGAIANLRYLTAGLHKAWLTSGNDGRSMVDVGHVQCQYDSAQIWPDWIAHGCGGGSRILWM